LRDFDENYPIGKTTNPDIGISFGNLNETNHKWLIDGSNEA
jgi:hypothetical protein